MYTKNLLEAYKEHMKFVQYKQIAHELGMSNQMVTDIRKGRAHLKENKALFIAEQIGEDKEKVLIGLAADRAKTTEEKALWEQISKKFEGLGKPTITMACTGLAFYLESLIQYALYVLMFNTKPIAIKYKSFEKEDLNCVVPCND